MLTGEQRVNDYDIQVTETVTRLYTVTADSPEEARGVLRITKSVEDKNVKLLDMSISEPEVRVLPASQTVSD